MKKMTPPTILKLFTEIPKNLNSNCPERAKQMIMMKETKDAFLAVNLRSRSDKSVVMVKKIGIVPNGLIRVKKEVRHKRPKVIKSSITTVLFIM
jgi:hypothetical protein|tara:strand:- start:6063 stop:6344 length:282 start_codon:yes stop_codon:yes gene_type:complete